MDDSYKLRENTNQKIDNLNTSVSYKILLYFNSDSTYISIVI